MKIIQIAAILYLMITNVYAGDATYCVQVAKCAKLENAVSIHDQLRQYKSKKIEKVKDYYEVTVGGYPVKTEALPLLKQLKTIYADAFIRQCTGVETRNHIPKTKAIAKQEVKKPALIPPVVAAKVSGPGKQQVTPPPPSNPKPEMPKVTLSDAELYFTKGMEHFQNKQYSESIGFLSQYVSLLPESSQCPTALFAMAKSMEAINRPKSALGVFGRILDQHPKSPEALLSVIAMAGVGVAHPALRYPLFKSGSEYVSDPQGAYDAILTRKLTPQMVEDVLLQKGRAFWKTEYYLKSYETFSRLMKEYPDSPYRKEIIGTLKASIGALIDQHQKGGDHVAAVNLFMEAKEKGFIHANDLEMTLKCSLSFAHIGLYDDSLKLIDALRSNMRGKESVDMDKTLAQINHIKLAHSAHPLQADMNWGLFQDGREYLKSNNLPLAEQTLAKLKKDGGDPFWNKITDYVLEGRRWAQKNQGDLIQKR